MPLLPARVKTVLTHLAAWIGYYLFELLYLVMLGGQVPHLLESAFAFTLLAALFYAHSQWLFPAYLARKRYGSYALGVFGLFVAFGVVRYGLVVHLLPATGITLTYPYTAALPFLALGYWRGLTFFVYSLVYSYARHSIGLQKQLRLQEQQLRVQERSLLEADIAFLKSQINPHFLFNALNFLYAQVYPLSEPTAKSVLLLSDIMRYALNEGGEQGKVMLEKEVQHLRNYLALNRLRFGDSLQVQFEVTGCTEYLMILPLVLITFVENCFKHGELFDPGHPLLLQLRLDENQLWLHTSNRKRRGPIEHSTGIGLDNTRRRLEAIYPNRYRLRIADEPETYTTHLHLTL